MRASTIGNSALIPVTGIEAVKWFALGAMLIEHVYRYVLDVFPFWVFLIGRSVFPLFALSLAFGLAGSWQTARPQRVIQRLLVWTVIAAAARAFVLPAMPLNVLFTLAAGCVVYLCALRGGWWSLLIAAVSCALSGFAEFGIFGAFAVAAAMAYADHRGRWWLAISLACVCASQAAIAPLAALPIAWAVSRVADGVPRVSGAFYWSYVGQWPLLAFLRVLS
ncbi:MAG TPA: TraX family protein [Povalibacter sp.]|uniref:TraX family protein n=1 Tax=Povalibacter sp. TaxID=1962978 RepID=UPI002B88DD68|nr:TraX family protein [Povalibacter sp.]HMN45895.1 TraX family protein [Povalibacter sp.]